VDATHLPHLGLPASSTGGAYHIITVYAVDETTALVGDRTDDAISIPLADLARARVTIKKDKHRLLSLPAAPASPKDLRPLVQQGLRACYDGLAGAGGVKSAATNFSLKALNLWAERLHGSSDKQSWERIFTPGPRLWQGLQSVYEYIEHYGTGGGLCRPLFADFLTEAAEVCADARLRDLGQRYAELGRDWTSLADAALPDAVPVFREARELHAKKAELRNSGGDADEIRAIHARLAELRQQVKEHFPLSDAECADLRAELQARVRALYEAEVATRDELGRLIA
jgi:hypothetical protein